jgi:transposase
MTDITSELKGRLIVGRKQDGRCVYDPQAKRELIEACMAPGVSVARLALDYGLNVNAD